MLGQSKTDKLVKVLKADLPKADRILDLEMKAGDADAQGNTAEADALREQSRAQMNVLGDHINLGMRPEGKGGLLYDAYAMYLFDITDYDLSLLFESVGSDSSRSSSDILADLQKYRMDIDHYLLDLQ